MAADPGAFRDQDGIVLAKYAPTPGSYPEWRWQSRAPDGWEDYNVRAAWREGEPIDADGHRAVGGGVARLHRPSGMLLVARWGILETVFADRPPAERRDDHG